MIHGIPSIPDGSSEYCCSIRVGFSRVSSRRRNRFVHPEADQARGGRLDDVGNLEVTEWSSLQAGRVGLRRGDDAVDSLGLRMRGARRA